ncbi:MAG: threonine--tRNA ligase [Flavobacteriales bacterium]|nr:threonine--tRNA ligase [Flavobacteriales bacterium]MCX7767968.1 threonine--tRNA ligase [Flavobacteriales bacterium]MDW8409173.1 threonine--tRNA ligase [Flavobacteriales bacterium]
MAEVQLTITLPDGSTRTFPNPTTAREIAASISEGLVRKALAALVDGQTYELDRPITRDARVRILTWEDPEGKAAFWHSSAHILAEAVQALYPHARFGIGPPIENGFYYDIDFGDTVLREEDLPALEAEMARCIAADNPFHLYPVSKEEALDYYRKKDNPYKLELIEGLQDGDITFCRQGDFVDLCRGGHVPRTGYVKAFKLTGIAGAYWRGNEKNKQLTRIYGISFPQKKMLDEYLQHLEEARRRDHRKLGRELELFTFSAQVGQGLPLWLPRGTVLRERLEAFLRKVQKKMGYQQVVTPHIGSKSLYVTSGHYEKYGKDSFRPILTPEEGEEYFLKPMNCPHHCEIYRSRQRSYRELPLRLAEFGTVYRYEQSGELSGLTRVRGFTQDDAHIFCRPDQVKEEFERVIDLVLLVFRALNFKEYTAQVSLRDPQDTEKYIGSEENWQKAEQAILEATREKGLDTVIVPGEAAFYGPKLDFMVRDAIGRKWQLGTIQVDYNLPERFDLEYVGEDNQRHRPVMIHRAPFGSLERFIAVLTEHCAGNFPLWLAPEQVYILPVSDKYLEYGREVKKYLEKYDICAQVDERSEKIGKKIRDAEMLKIPVMLIVGEKEVSSRSVSLRRHGVGDQGTMSLEACTRILVEEIRRATEFEEA